MTTVGLTPTPAQPLPAQKSQIPAFAIPTDPVKMLLSEVRKYLPKIASGRIQATQTGWISAPYVDIFSGEWIKFNQLPTLLVVAESRSGWFTLTKLTPPSLTIKLPSVNLPPALDITWTDFALPPAFDVGVVKVPNVSISRIVIPSVQVPPFPTINGVAITLPKTPGGPPEGWAEWIKNNLPPLRGQDDWTPVFNWIKDAFRGCLADLLGHLWNYVYSQVDAVRKNAETAVNDAIAKISTGINTGLTNTQAKIQAAVNDALTYTQTTLDNFTSNVNNAILSVTTGVNGTLGNLRDGVLNAQTYARNQIITLQNKFRDFVIPKLNDQFRTTRDNLQTVLDGFRVNAETSINGALTKVTAFSADAVNNAIPNLWKMLGIPEGTIVSAIPYKAKLATFDFLSPGGAGAVIHWVALGT